MTALEKKQLKVVEYRRLAIAATAMAETSVLAHVREKHERAAAQWAALAILGEQPISPRPEETPRAAWRGGPRSVRCADDRDASVAMPGPMDPTP